MWWLELADYFILKSRLLHNTTERSNIWFFLILKTLGPLQFSKPPLAQPRGAEWAGWAPTSTARSWECWPRNRSWAWQPQLTPNPGHPGKGNSDIRCHLPPVLLWGTWLTAQVGTRLTAKPATSLKQIWGLGFEKKTKTKKSPKPTKQKNRT